MPCYCLSCDDVRPASSMRWTADHRFVCGFCLACPPESLRLLALRRRGIDICALPGAAGR